jgi:hypothetical protein
MTRKGSEVRVLYGPPENLNPRKGFPPEPPPALRAAALPCQVFVQALYVSGTGLAPVPTL